MRDDQDGELKRVAQPEEQLQDLAPDGRVEVGHRLIRHDHLRVEHERPGDHDSLALSSRELVRVEQVEAFGWTQAGAGQRSGDHLLLGLSVGASMDAVDPEPLRDALVDRLARVQ